MLTHLHIQNFALIADVNLDFKSGMTVITGESGAGKSIVIDALQAALGARSDSSMVRHGCQQADIAVTFDMTALPSAQSWLKAAALENDTSPECILRRTLSQEGRSKQFINGQPVTQNQLRQLAEHLISIQGQHEHQCLTDSHFQLKLLDDFANHPLLITAVTEAYAAWQHTQKAILDLQNQEHTVSQIELLTYQVAELTQLGAHSGEEAELAERYKKLAQSDRLLQECGQLRDLLSENETANVLHLLKVAHKKLHSLRALDTSFEKIATSLEAAESHLQEATETLEEMLASLDLDPSALSHIENRLQILHEAARKYKVSPNELSSLLEKFSARLEDLTQQDEQRALLEKKLELLAQTYQDAARKLSASRQAAAKRFEKEVRHHIQSLAMPEGHLRLAFESLEKFSPEGSDKMTFLISANPGQPLKPLNKIASGGELSRVSLAIHATGAQLSGTPCLVFDEVDVGISGGTAEKVGQLLSKLSHKAQVICITHLAQVARFGTQHVQIQKQVLEGQTYSQLIELNEKARIEEIARLLGGLKITDKTREHAREMLEAT